MIRFIHTADWQLGMTRHFLDDDAQPRFNGARLDAVAAIGALAQQRGCSFVVVAGDVFETNQVDRSIVVRALEAMGAAREVRWFLLPGNHDPLDAGSVYRSRSFERSCPPNVVVLDTSEPIEVRPGVEIVAAPWRTKRPVSDLVHEAVADLPADGTVRIVVGHGAVDAPWNQHEGPATIRLAPLEAALAEGRCHYVALGDRHSRTEVGATGRVWYSGAPEPTDFREVDPGHVLEVAIDRADGSAPPQVTSHPVATWRFVRTAVELAGDLDVDDLDGFLASLPDRPRTVVRLELTGQLTFAQHARLDDVIELHRAALASLERWDDPGSLVVLPAEDDFGDLELSGFARAALEDLRTQLGGDPAAAAVATDALALLYRLGSAGAPASGPSSGAGRPAPSAGQPPASSPADGAAGDRHEVDDTDGRAVEVPS